MKKVVIGATVVVLALGVWLLYVPSKNEIYRDVYARVCNDIIRSALITPSSMEISRIRSMDTELSLQQALAIHEGKGLSAKTETAMLSLTREKFDRGEPFVTATIAVEYSADNKLGGRTDGIGICDFIEEGNPSPMTRTLTKVILDDDVFEGDTLDAFLIQKGRPERVATLGWVELREIPDRFNYLIDPQIEKR